ncbi:hypothetical protein ACFV0Y_02950 [Streptomyces sp. NPDC059569]|uniref:hypothetical protein n=1 Tax=Streptomyces sp. NPDC059569 TaxID=3346869 RepID=UPI00369A98AE
MSATARRRPLDRFLDCLLGGEVRVRGQLIIGAPVGTELRPAPVLGALAVKPAAGVGENRPDQPRL